MGTWQLQEAKARFSEVVRKATSEGPQEITVHGHQTAVVLNFDDYSRLIKKKPAFVDFMRASPLVGADLDLEREQTPDRQIGKKACVLFAISFILSGCATNTIRIGQNSIVYIHYESRNPTTLDEFTTSRSYCEMEARNTYQNVERYNQAAKYPSDPPTGNKYQGLAYLLSEFSDSQSVRQSATQAACMAWYNCMSNKGFIRRPDTDFYGFYKFDNIKHFTVTKSKINICEE
ncbi:MAG: type II toxin-antitoxin system Phd/YefM family antitoxin [Magnetococcales bacterium]|nr:type II toxin-antitoxin system Phd/YefM family antitoxin [Magnetococcales bacterium]